MSPSLVTGRDRFSETHHVADGAASKRSMASPAELEATKRPRTDSEPQELRAIDIHDISKNARIVYIVATTAPKGRKSIHSYLEDYPSTNIAELVRAIGRPRNEIQRVCVELCEIGLLKETVHDGTYIPVSFSAWGAQQDQRTADIQTVASLSKAPDEHQRRILANVTALGEQGLPAGPDDFDSCHVYDETSLYFDMSGALDYYYLDDDDDKGKKFDPIARVAREWQDCTNSSVVGIEGMANEPVSHRSGGPRLLAVERVKEWFDRNYCRDICKLSSNPLSGVGKRSRKVYEQLRSLVQTYPFLERVEECAVAHTIREPVSKVHACFLELFKTGLIQTNRTSKSCLPVPLDLWRQRRRIEQQKLNDGQHAEMRWPAVPGHRAEDREIVKIAKQHHSTAESGAQVAAREKAEEVSEDEDGARSQITIQAKKATKKRRNEASCETGPAKRQRTDEQQSRHNFDFHDPLASLSQSAKDVYAAASALVIEKQTDWLRWIAHATMGYPIQEVELVERLESSKDVIYQACSELCDAGLMKEKSSLKRWYYTIPNAELQANSRSTTVASWNERGTEFEEHVAATIKKDYNSEAEESTSVEAAEGPLLNDASGSVSAPPQADETVDVLTSLQRRREVDIWDPLSSISKNAQTVYKAATAHRNVRTARSEEADLGPHITTRNLLGRVRHYYHLRKSDEYLLRFCTELCDLGLLKLLRKDRWVPVEVKAWRFQLQEDMDVAWSSVTGPLDTGSTGGDAASARSAADRVRAAPVCELQYFDHAHDLEDPLANVSKRCRLLYWHMQDTLVEMPYLESFQENVLAGIFHRSIHDIHKDMLELRRYGLATFFLLSEDGWLPVPLGLWREQRGKEAESEGYTRMQCGQALLPCNSEEEQDEEDGDVREDIEVEKMHYSERSGARHEDGERQRLRVKAEERERVADQHEEGIEAGEEDVHSDDSEAEEVLKGAEDQESEGEAVSDPEAEGRASDRDADAHKDKEPLDEDDGLQGLELEDDVGGDEEADEDATDAEADPEDDIDEHAGEGSQLGASDHEAQPANCQNDEEVNDEEVNDDQGEETEYETQVDIEDPLAAVSDHAKAVYDLALQRRLDQSCLDDGMLGRPTHASDMVKHPKLPVDDVLLACTELHEADLFIELAEHIFLPATCNQWCQQQGREEQMRRERTNVPTFFVRQDNDEPTEELEEAPVETPRRSAADRVEEAIYIWPHTYSNGYDKPLNRVGETAKASYHALQKLVKRDSYIERVEARSIAYTLSATEDIIRKAFAELHRVGLVVFPNSGNKSTCLPVPLNVWEKYRRLTKLREAERVIEWKAHQRWKRRDLQERKAVACEQRANAMWAQHLAGE
ncbi:hypothetical protein LTR56_005297 [Elasticomyces elasticus]|nr:hypothetical protein LTR56_005297 [Elasticomyces elasticus]KAK4923673.1 hypothetical protein LTR49_009228 [Elasticomyces elasticus]KAK5762039.1 hypothetical protein LTS12_007736 [Elasticomyces elasticus]